MAEDDSKEQRHSLALDAELVTDPQAKAEAEARNGLRQFDIAEQIAQQAIERGRFRLRLSALLALHRAALRDISAYAGNFRPAGVEIEGSKHQPPGAHLVPELVEEMCDYVNEQWDTTSALHLSAYVMWRLNWIHPFADGNGRTSRALSYVVLCVRLGYLLPGSPTIPEQIVQDRSPYFEALDAADAAYAEGKIDVSAMEEMLSGMLAEQLKSIYEQAGGQIEDEQ
ncbi:Fic family protein [Microbaculum marinum]|uniref:Fic family protein n=1 Tax=Microbaculum marinum TaxID=1764581 RepID=A0AAW9RWR4_9HYPH